MKKEQNVLEGEIAQVTVLGGDDYIGREKAKEKIISRLYTLHNDLTEERFDSSIEPFEAYVEKIITPSLFASVRIFHVLHAQQLSDSDIKKLGAVLSVAFTDVYVLIEFEPKTGKSKGDKVPDKLSLKERIKKEPQKYNYLRFDKPPNYKMAEWLTIQVPLLFNRTMSRTGAESLLDLAGHELDTLYTELQKIDIHLPDKAPIEKEAVERIIGATRTMTPFELAEALGRKQLPRALEIIDSLFQSSFYAPPCLAAIFAHFWKVFKVRAFALDNREKARSYFGARYAEQTAIAYEIGVAAGLLQKEDAVKKAYPVMVLSGVIDQARAFSDEQLRKIFEWLREFDVGVKTGTVKPTKTAMHLLCYRIVRVAELVAKEAVT